MTCADNTDAKNLSIMTVKGIGGRLNKITVTRLDVMCVRFVKKGNLVFRKKVMFVVVICQRQSRHRKESIFIYFEDNAGVIVNLKGEMKGSAITRPVSQEHLPLLRMKDFETYFFLWPIIGFNANFPSIPGHACGIREHAWLPLLTRRATLRRALVVRVRAIQGGSRGPAWTQRCRLSTLIPRIHCSTVQCQRISAFSTERARSDASRTDGARAPRIQQPTAVNMIVMDDRQGKGA